MTDQFLDRNNLKPMLAGDCQQGIPVGSVPFCIEYFTEHAGWLHAGQAGQIDRGLCMASPPEDASLLGNKREQVTRPDKILWTTVGVEQRRNGRGPLASGNARPRRNMIDRHSEGGPQRGGVGFNHQRQIEPLSHIGQQGHADLPATVGDHEVHRFGCRMLSRTNKVSFIFSILGIHNDHNFSLLESHDGGINRTELLRHRVGRVTFQSRNSCGW